MLPRSPDEHHALVTDVFLRGVQHIFYDEDERNAFVNNLAAYTDKLPLVPVSVVARMIENAVNMASASVTNALTTSYHEYGDAVRGRRHHELAVRRHPLEDPHTESQRKKAHEKPFEHVLRYNMCLELMDPKEDIFGRLQLVMPESMPVCKSNLQTDFNVCVFESFDTGSLAVLRELDESNRFVQKSAESTSI